MVTDNATYFRSKEFKRFTFSHAIAHHRIVAYKPSGNKSERYLRNVKCQLRCYFHNCQNQWDKDLHNLQICFNTCYSEKVGNTPHNVMFKHPPNHALSNLWKLNDLVNESYTPEQIREVMDKALSNVKRSISQSKNRERYNQDRVKHPFVLGSKVYLQNHFLSKKGYKYQGKMDLRFSGPYELIHFLNPVTVLIQLMQNRKEVKRVNISQLKLG